MDHPAKSLDFQALVLDQSHRIPVLVDFWAPWCSPCRMLGPVLDQLAGETDQWVLVKVNTEEETDLARTYQIQSIPHVKLFVRGVPIAEFSGALSQGVIRHWLGTHLPDPCRDAWHDLKKSLTPWPDEQRSVLLDELEHPCREQEEWIVARAAMDVFDTPESAWSSVATIHTGHPLHNQAEAIREVARLVQLNQQEVGSKSLRVAARTCQARQVEEAIKALIQAIGEDRYQLDEMPRKAVIGLFTLLGEHHALTRQYRPWFAMALN